MDQITAEQIRSLKENGMRVLTGVTFAGTPDSTNQLVRLDNNADPNQISNPVYIPSIIGPMPAGIRVVVLVTPPMGMLIIGVTDGKTSLPGRDINEYSIVRRAYTANDTWTKPTDSRFYAVIVSLQGGGGGSGGTGAEASGSPATACSGGGQGGYYLSGYIAGADLTATCSVVVGAGGLGAAAGANPGGNGGDSEFRDASAVAYLIAPGGAGGDGGNSSTAANHTNQGGGTGTQSPTVDVRAFSLDFQQGDDGGTGFRYLAAAPQIINPGFGGGSRMGGMRRMEIRGSGQISPAAGYLFGGGASGRGVALTGPFAAGTGAAGGQGIVLVQELYRV